MLSVAVGPSEAMAAAERSMSGRFRWGVSDCCTGACDAFEILWGVDPMAPLRGYRKGVEARAWIASFGGFGPMVTTLTGRAGLVTATNGSRPGDLGHFVGWKPRQDALAICVGGGWAIKSHTGLSIVKTGIVWAWRYEPS